MCEAVAGENTVDAGQLSHGSIGGRQCGLLGQSQNQSQGQGQSWDQLLSGDVHRSQADSDIFSSVLASSSVSDLWCCDWSAPHDLKTYETSQLNILC